MLKIRLTNHIEERNGPRIIKDEKKPKNKEKRKKYMFTRDIGEDMNLRILLHPSRINIAILCCRAQMLYSIPAASLPSTLRNYFIELPPIYKHLAAATIKCEEGSLSFSSGGQEIRKLKEAIFK